MVWNNWCTGERDGSVVECRTPEREVRGSIPTAAVLCPWARHFTPRKYWLITQEAVAPSRHDWKIVDWDVKPQHKQTTGALPYWRKKNIGFISHFSFWSVSGYSLTGQTQRSWYCCRNFEICQTPPPPPPPKETSEKGVFISERWLWIYEERCTWICMQRKSISTVIQYIAQKLSRFPKGASCRVVMMWQLWQIPSSALVSYIERYNMLYRENFSSEVLTMQPGYPDSRSVQKKFSLITSFIQDSVDKNIPSKTSRAVSSVPWITSE